jgi:hypothetical protein
MARVAPATARLDRSCPGELAEDADHIAGHQDGREQPVDHRAVEQPVNVVQVVTEHGDVDRGIDAPVQDGEPDGEGQRVLLSGTSPVTATSASTRTATKANHFSCWRC